jgi:ABC-type multidrug transport system ATPase subunit
MLETIQLSKSFKGKKAVQNVSLYLDHGESVGLIGPNGAGKSTTISMISTLIKPTAGEIRLKGMNVVDKPGEMRKVLGIVPQELALYEELSAYENLKFFGSIYKIRNKDHRRKNTTSVRNCWISRSPQRIGENVFWWDETKNEYCRSLVASTTNPHTR